MSVRYKPCEHCPFRSDIKPYLRHDRAVEIAESIEGGATFPCHETTKFDDEGDVVPSRNEKFCAGALSIMERMDQPNQMMRILERIGAYDRDKLDISTPVYDSFDDWIDAHED